MISLEMNKKTQTWRLVYGRTEAFCFRFKLYCHQLSPHLTTDYLSSEKETYTTPHTNLQIDYKKVIFF